MSATAWVVAGALIVDGTVLLAQRAHPPALRGLWELPGGKVDRGEQLAEALRRELAEELGVTVEVGAVIEPDIALGAGRVLRAFQVVLVAGEPRPHEHLAVRWVGPGELQGAAWVPHDRAWIPALTALLTRS